MRQSPEDRESAPGEGAVRSEASAESEALEGRWRMGAPDNETAAEALLDEQSLNSVAAPKEDPGTRSREQKKESRHPDSNRGPLHYE
jgi:hypothetical protein